MSGVFIIVMCADCGERLYHHVGTEWVEKDGQLRAEIVVATEHECGGKSDG